MAKRTVLKSGSVLLPDVGMSQSSLMVGALIAGFVVWVMMNGKLATYWSILLGGGASATATATTATPSATTAQPSASTTAPSNASLGLPTTQGSVLGLGGTASTSTTATGGVGTATPTGVPGLPNVSLSNFFGLGS